MGVDWRVLDAVGWLVGLWIPEAGALFSRESLSGGPGSQTRPEQLCRADPHTSCPESTDPCCLLPLGKRGPRGGWVGTEGGVGSPCSCEPHVWVDPSALEGSPFYKWRNWGAKRSVNCLQLPSWRQGEVLLPERLWYHSSLKKWASLLVLGLAESSLRERNELCDLSRLPL